MAERITDKEILDWIQKNGEVADGAYCDGYWGFVDGPCFRSIRAAVCYALGNEAYNAGKMAQDPRRTPGLRKADRLYVERIQAILSKVDSKR